MLNRPLIAIDIGSSAIKVVELSGTKRKKLCSLGLEVLPEGAVVDGMMTNQEAVEGVLRDLLKKLKIRTTGRRAAVSVNGSAVLIKKVGITAKDAALEETVFYEAEQQFQTDMNELYFDYDELGEAAAGAGGGQPVLMVGAKREMVEQYLGLIRAVGMRTGVVESGAFSAANMFEYNYGVVAGLTALINIGASHTQVSLVSHGAFVYARDIAVGGDAYSRRVMELLGVDRANAEALKVAVSQGGGNVPPEMHKVLGEVNEQLVHEVQVTIDYFFQNAENAAGGGGGGGGASTGLTSVFLTGGGSRILGLDAALAAALQIPVQIINPFQRVDINPKKFQMDYLLMQGHLYGVAVGLSLRAMGDKD